jgi:hypothetical protein
LLNPWTLAPAGCPQLLSTAADCAVVEHVKPSVPVDGAIVATHPVSVIVAPSVTGNTHVAVDCRKKAKPPFAPKSHSATTFVAESASGYASGCAAAMLGAQSSPEHVLNIPVHSHSALDAVA